MRKLIIILILFCSLVTFGQMPQTGLTRWVSGYDIVGSDTLLTDSITGVGASNLVLTNCADQLTNINNGYISAKSKCQLNGQYITTLFQNHNYADTSYHEMLTHTLNADSTEALPYRLNSLSYYSTAQTGADKTFLDSYFSVPSTGSITVKKSGGDYSTTTDAIVAASAGDTIDVYEGTYKEANITDLTKAVTVRAVGKCTLQSTNVNQVSVLRVSGAKLSGFVLDGENNTLTGIINVTSAATAEKCVFENYTQQAYQRMGSGAIINKCGFLGSSDYVINVSTYPYSFEVSECYFNVSMAGSNPLISSINAVDSVTHNIKYNTFDNLTDIIITSRGVVNFDYNQILSNYSNVKALSLIQPSVRLPYRIRGNSMIMQDNGESFSLLTNLIGNYNITVYNNNLTTLAGGGALFKLIEDRATTNFNNYHIHNNTIDVYRGWAISFEDFPPGATTNISNNAIYLRYAANNNDIYTVSLLDFNASNSVTVAGNEIRNPKFFGESFGGHAALYLSGTRNASISYNKISGAGISSVVFKGDGLDGASSFIIGGIYDNVLIKGVRKSKIYNNVFYNSDKYGLGIIENQDVGTTDKRADSTEVYNNIFYTCDTAILIDNQNNLAANTFSNYNDFFNNDVDVNYNVANQTLAWWQSNFSQDLNSLTEDPLFQSSTELWSNNDNVKKGGADLGSPYNLGLDITSTFPDGIILKERIAPWSIGAYQNRDIETFGVKINKSFFIGGNKGIIITQ